MTAATIIDGKAIAGRLTDNIAGLCRQFTQKADMPPCLAVVLVGDDPASAVYVRNKTRTAEKIGIKSIQKTLPAGCPENSLIDIISELNDDSTVHGILVQLPLPAQIDERKIINLIAPEKDVDGFHPVNVGRLSAGDIGEALTPCTPTGCVALAKSVLGEELNGRHTVIIGRSNIVGKPAAQLFLHENCTVTVAHSKTKNLKDIVRLGDIVVAAVGRPAMVKGDWIKPGAVVIDVGINRVPADDTMNKKYKLVGDVDFEGARAVAGAITPVPGGVGPMTIALLMRNTLIAACRQNAQCDLIENIV